MFRKRQKGFTLVELLVVMAIIAILASIVVPNVAKYIRKSRMTRALAEIKSIELALTNILTDADRSSLHQLFNPQGVSAYLDGYGTALNMEAARMDAAIRLYTNTFYAIMRTGRATLADKYEDITFANVLNANVVSRLGTSYLADLGRDPWGSLYQIYPGPWPARMRPAGGGNTVDNPNIFRIYRVDQGGSDLPGSRGGGRSDVLTVEILDEATGAQERVGYAAPRDTLAFIWSFGENLISGQAIYTNTGYTANSWENYRDQEEAYLGGGDDVNNWDSVRSWERLYN